MENEVKGWAAVGAIVTGGILALKYLPNLRVTSKHSSNGNLQRDNELLRDRINNRDELQQHFGRLTDEIRGLRTDIKDLRPVWERFGTLLERQTALIEELIRRK